MFPVYNQADTYRDSAFQLAVETTCQGCQRPIVPVEASSVDIGLTGHVTRVSEGLARFQSWAPSGGNCSDCGEAVHEHKLVASLPSILVVEASRAIGVQVPIALDPVVVSSADLGEQRNVARVAVLYNGNGRQGHWWASTFTAGGDVECVLNDADIRTLAESAFARSDLEASWRLAVYVPQMGVLFTSEDSKLPPAGRHRRRSHR